MRMKTHPVTGIGRRPHNARSWMASSAPLQ